MTDQKPKHKPQKKRTLEEVLKSLQDLIRNDLVSAKPLQESWRESGRTTPGPRTAAGEPDSFQDALFKLDQIISEKIIEPVERAKQTPPEPLYPDEEIEIEWEGESEPESAAEQQAQIEPSAPAAFDSDSIPPAEEIEIEALAPDAAPPTQPVAESKAEARIPTPGQNSASSIENATQYPAPEPGVEEIEATAVEVIEVESAPPSMSASPTPVESPEAQTPTEAAEDHQQTFDFNAAAPAAVAKSVPEPRSDPEPPTKEPRDVETQRTMATATERNTSSAAAGSSSRPDGVSATPTAPPEESLQTVPEQPDIAAVESNKAADSSAFTVEFTVEPKPTPPKAAASHDAGGRAGGSAPAAKPSTDNAKPPEKTGVKKKPQSSNPGDAAKQSLTSGGDENTPKAREEIPILEEVADLTPPPSAPLPSASQARDIAIRVIARLNIERRKAGQKPLDIKTIERLQQYLADALTKRELNKPK